MWTVFFVSNYVGKTAFAAVNLMAPVTMAVSAIGFMMGTGGSAIVSKTMGEGKTDLANQYFSMLVFASLIGAAVISTVGFLLTPQIALAMGAKDQLLKDSVVYGRILFCSVPVFVLQMAFQSFFVAAEKPGLSLVSNVAAGLANAILDYLMIAVFSWGLAGAAAATAIGQLIGGVFSLIYFSRKNSSLLRLNRKFKMNWKVLLFACANGSSEMVSSLSTSIVSILFNSQLLKIAGENGIAAYGVIMYTNIVFSGVNIGFSIGSAPLVSFHYGAQNHEELKNLRRKSVVLMGFSGVFMSGLAIILARPLAMIFTGYDSALFEMTTHGCTVYAIAYLFMGMNIWASSFFTALNNGGVSAAISFLRTFAFQVLSVLILPAIIGIDGIWMSVVVAEAMAIIVSSLFLITERKKYHY